MSLRERLVDQIRIGGPITVVQYMTLCLHDPQDGYYATRPAIRSDGDFITAPLISQMFGEMIGLWLIETWSRLGRPAPFRLVEMGPGDGSLMHDILRTARLVPDFLAAADVWLVEASAPLRTLQAQKLGSGPKTCPTLAEVPDGAPLLLVANELLDCLPIHQWVRTPSGWAERCIGINDSGDLVFGLSEAPYMASLPDAEAGMVMETSPAQEALGTEVADRLVQDGGAALLIDYGRGAPGPGDTLQAIGSHRKEHPLAHPGQVDLTAHADFPAVLAAARAAGAATAPLLDQATFLARLGIFERAERLAQAQPERTDQIGRQLERLVAPDQMGELFKVACLHVQGLVPPGFETET